MTKNPKPVQVPTPTNLILPTLHYLQSSMCAGVCCRRHLHGHRPPSAASPPGRSTTPPCSSVTSAHTPRKHHTQQLDYASSSVCQKNNLIVQFLALYFCPCYEHSLVRSSSTLLSAILMLHCLSMQCHDLSILPFQSKDNQLLVLLSIKV